MQVHVGRDGAQYGPFSLDEVNAHLSSGRLLETDLAWYEGSPQWVPITMVPGVAHRRPPALQPRTSPAPAPSPPKALPRPTDAAEADTSLPPVWQRRFAIIDKAGGYRIPDARTLPAGELRAVIFNILAFLLGIIWYIAKGMWKRGLIILLWLTVASCAIEIMLMLAAPSLLLRAWNQPSIIVAVMYGVLGTRDYYRFRRENWRPTWASFCIALFAATLAMLALLVVAAKIDEGSLSEVPTQNSPATVPAITPATPANVTSPVPSASSGKVQATSPPLRSLPDPFQPSAALQMLFGPLSADGTTAHWQGISVPKTPEFSQIEYADGVVSVVAASPYFEAGQSKYFLIAATTNKDHTCHSCGAILSTATFVRNNDRWILLYEEKYFALQGNFGAAPQTKVVKLGDQMFGALLDIRYSQSGLTSSWAEIFAPVSNRIGMVWGGTPDTGVVIQRSYCNDADNPSNCIKMTGSLQLSPVAGKEWYDITLRRQGQLMDESDGKIQQVDDTTHFAFDGNRYVSRTSPPPPVTIKSIQLGSAIDAGKNVTNPMTTFGRYDTIFASVATDGTGAEAKLDATWTYQTGESVNKSTVTIAPTGATVSEFHISKPDGWPPGAYHVEILLDGKPAGSASYQVR